jgi:translocation and assembly module TamB
MTLGPWLRRIVLALAALVGAAAAGAAGLMVFIHTGAGERWTAAIAERRVAGLSLQGYHLGWPFRMRAHSVRLADDDGVWLEIDGAEVVWHPLRLWRRQLDIDRLVADRAEIKRLPAGGGGGGAEWRPPWRSLRLDEARVPIQLAAPVLGQPLALDLAGTFRMQRGGGDVAVSLRSRGGGFALLEGTAGLDYLDLRWSLRLPDLAAAQALVGQRLAGSVTGSGFIVGRLPNPAVSGRIDAGQGGAGPLEWSGLALSGEVVPAPDLWRVTAHAELHRPTFDRQPLPAPMAALTMMGDIAPDSGRIRLGDAWLTAGPAQMQASGVLNGWGGSAVLWLRGDSGMQTMAGASGRVRVRGIVAGNLGRGAVDGRLRAAATRLTTGVAVLDRALGPHPCARLSLHLRGNHLRLSGGEVTGARATVSAAGSVTPRLGLWARLSLPELAVLADNMQGSGVAWGHVHGTALAGLARLSDLRVGDTPPISGDVAFDLAQLAHPQGPLSALARVGTTPVAGRTWLDTADGVRLRDISLRSGDARVAGELVIKDGVRGHLSGSIPDLRAWENLAGRPLAGKVEGDAVLDPARGQSLHLALSGQGLSIGGVTLPALTATGDAHGLGAAPTGSVTIDTQAELGGSRIDAIHLRASAQPGRVLVEQAEATLDSVPLRLLRPTRLDWQGGGASLQPAMLALGGGRIELSGRASTTALDARARLEGVPLMLVRVAAPMDAAGTVSGTIAASGTPAAPVVRFALDGRDVGMAAAARAGVGRMAAHLAGVWRDGRAQGDATLRDGQRVQAQASFSLPVPGDGPLAARFTLSGDAGRLAEALPLAGHVIAGQLDANGQAGGTLGAPVLSARATLSNGRYENLDSGTIITALTATATFDGDRIRVHADGGDGAQGRMTLDGGGGLDGGYGADIYLDRFTALRRDDVEAAVSGSLRLDGNGENGTVAGQLAVARAEIDVGRIKGGGPVALDVIEINRPTPVAAPPAPAPAEGPLTVALAVRVAVEHAFVRGHGLDSEWQGNLDVAGTLSQPSLTGKLAAARGQFDFLGKPFKLSPDSTVTFAGGDRIDPGLDVTAEASATDITAQVQVTGTAHDPQFAFTSQPPLPQDEVLARLLFGREAGKLSTFQQVQLAQLAATGLTGGGGGFDPIGAVRGFLGLDVLGVGSADDKPGAAGAAGPTLSAGKYLGPDTFVRVEQGTSGLGKVVVEQEVGRGFSLESSLGEQSGGGVGLNWRLDY